MSVDPPETGDYAYMPLDGHAIRQHWNGSRWGTLGLLGVHRVLQVRYPAPGEMWRVITKPSAA